MLLIYFIVSEVKVTESCLTLCDPMDYIVHGTLQARILEWVAVPFSRGSSQPRDQTQVSCLKDKFFIPAELLGKPNHIDIWSTRQKVIKTNKTG